MNKRLSEAHIQFPVDAHNLCMVFHAFFSPYYQAELVLPTHQVLTVHHCSLDKNPKIVQVICQKSRECLTMVSKHEKAYEAQGAKP